MARSAASFTTDSNAIAATMPGWLSSALSRRVPKRTTKKPIATAVQSAVSAGASSPTRAAKECVTARSWRAMYGVTAAIAITVTRTETVRLLP